MSLKSGNQFTAEITITRSGIVAVRYDQQLINIGPVTCKKGERVRLKYLGEKEELGNDVGFAICLNEEILDDGYDDYIRGIMDHLITDEPPAQGETTYTEIDQIGERNMGVTILNGDRIQLGPARGEVGDLVRIVGVSDNCAEIMTPHARGENYEIRFKILSRQFDELPIAVGEEVTTTISDIDDGELIGYVGDIPIRFPGTDAEMAQKVDGRIIGVDADRFVGEVVKTYDEPGRIEHASYWARMQWLRQAGFSDDPLRDFAQDFFYHNQIVLPETTERLRDALIAEAIRLAVADKTGGTDEEYPRAHISGVRHWVNHKLAAIFGEPGEDDTDDWFRDILKERSGPTITFLGDILELSEGYYAPAPTHAVMTTSSDAVLVSGRPIMTFANNDLEIQIRGVTRIITGTTEDELLENDIPVQSRSEYVGLDGGRLFTEDDLVSFIANQPREDWMPEQNWEPYTGQQWGFQSDGDPLEVEASDGSVVSFWHIPVEYGQDVYRLKVQQSSSDSAQMIAVPSRYRKHVSLLVDALSGIPQRVELKETADGVLVNCDFVPPRHQIRWLHAIGAEWLETSKNQLQWQIRRNEADSVVRVFEPLPVSLADKTGA